MPKPISNTQMNSFESTAKTETVKLNKAAESEDSKGERTDWASRIRGDYGLAGREDAQTWAGF